MFFDTMTENARRNQTRSGINCHYSKFVKLTLNITMIHLPDITVGDFRFAPKYDCFIILCRVGRHCRLLPRGESPCDYCRGELADDRNCPETDPGESEVSTVAPVVLTAGPEGDQTGGQDEPVVWPAEPDVQRAQVL